ncbi:ArsR family transcriptional regulator [Antricoccus suffuscus]|uniref:ArsR family transcriptional regulator n=2 Tax=Antricoccus suffuscus TaxID=1629062 RepID=A0A2T1A4A2_9ACTN|nr:ArsR family transcriptional regulator [Antricoccus suffuscus]
MALADGRSLPASVLAAEAGLSAPATSTQLTKLREAGLVYVEPSGRHRYYRLAGHEVAAVLEAMAQIAPAKPIRSLREGTRANALRTARTCYDHLAGRLGVSIMTYLLGQHALQATDGAAEPRRRTGDRLSAPVAHHPYQLGSNAPSVLERFGVDLAGLQNDETTRRPLMKFCMDWTEQQHHVAGRLGAAIRTSFASRGWTTQRSGQRVVRLTDTGRAALGALFELSDGISDVG